MITSLHQARRSFVGVVLSQKRMMVWLSMLSVLVFSTGISAQLSVSFQVTDVQCGNAATGSITATPSGGTAPYRFAWSTGDTTATINKLTPATYSVTVTDAALQSVVRSATVKGSPPIVVTFTTSQNCSGPVTVTASASGGQGPYQYFWDMGTSGATATFVQSGKFCVTVIDSKHCGRIECVEVSVDPLKIALQAQGVTCPEGNNGSVTSTVTGGTGPYTYLWSNGATTANLTNVPGGTYSVTVTDSKGCKANASATVTTPPPFVVNILSSGPKCEGDFNGSIFISSVSGGLPPYRFLWNTGQTTNSLANLGQGPFSVTITDAANCTVVRQVNLLTQSKLRINVTPQNETCPGEEDGRITVTAQDGVLPYTFAWSDGGSGGTRTGLKPGLYSVTVTDAARCQKSATVTIQPAGPFAISISKTDAVTCGVGTGSAEVTVTQGTGPFTYRWSNNQTTARINNLLAGTYRVTVTDGRGCTLTDSVTINEPPGVNVSIMATDVLCEGDRSGTATAIVTGGTLPFVFLWSNGASTQRIENLAPGTYRVTVTDKNGCEASAQATIRSASNPQLTLTGSGTICSGLDTGRVTAQVTGGTMPYVFRWNTGNNTATITNLGSGTYVVTVTDANKCTDTDSVRILVVPPVNLSVMTAPVTCYGDRDGSVMVTATGGLPPVTFRWSNNATGAKLENLAAGTYSVTATDEAGCTATASVQITQPDSLKLTLRTSDLDCGEPGTGRAVVQVQGGTAPYSFLWNTGVANDTLNGLNPGTYTVVVTDAEGCEKTGSVTIRDFGAPQCNIVVTKSVSSPTAADGEATVFVTGGVAPYDIRWSDGQTGDKGVNLKAQEYSVTITDANGCRTVCTVTPTSTKALVGDFVWFDINQNGIQDPGEVGVPGIIVIITPVTENDPPKPDTTVTDGSGKYFFVVDPGVYKITFVLPDTFQFSTPLAGTDTLKDSNADRIMGMTQIFSIAPGQIDLSWDAGLIKNVNLFPFIECECLNNATAKGNGQFREVLELQSLTGDTWRIIEQTGMFLSSSPAPPAEPLPVPVGTVLTEIRTGVYQLEFRHVDGIGYRVKVSNGMDTVILENLCRYPEIRFGNLPDSYCFNDAPQELGATATQPGTLQYFLNGQRVTSIDPKSLTPGLYLLKVRFLPDNPLDCEAVDEFPFRIVTENCDVKIGDFAWEDTNRNGFQDAGEPGIRGVKVILHRVTNVTVAVDSTFTDATGMYMFSVKPGNYKLTFVLPGTHGDYAPTQRDAFNNDARDSDIDPATGMTPVIQVLEGRNDFTIDAGYIIPCINLTDPGEIGYNQTLCGPGGNPDPLVSIRDASGGVGELEYLWMYSTTAGQFNATSYIAIPNSNSPTYDPGPLYSTTYFARCARRVGCPNFLEPEVVTVTVEDKARAQIASKEFYCLDELINLRVETKTENAQVKWELSTIFGDVNIEPRVAFGKVATFTAKSLGRVEVKVTVTENGCTLVTNSHFVITNSATYCTPENLAVVALVNNRNQVNLRWRMRDDGLNYTFQVQRGADDQRMSSIGTVSKSMTTFDGYRYYDFMDSQVKNGRNFYRIMVEDAFGSRRYSNVVSVAIQPSSAEPTVAYAYPNPVESILYMDILKDIPVNERIEIELFQSNGRILRTWNLPASQVQERIDLSDMPTGMYFLRVKVGAQDTEMIKVIKR